MRLRFNLGVLLAEDDPVASTRVIREVVDIAEGLGAAPWFVRAVVAWAGDSVDRGENWEDALRLIDDARSRLGDVPPHDLVRTSVAVRAARGDDADDLLAELEGLPHAPHQAAPLAVGRTYVLLPAGRFREAIEAAERAIDLDETGEAAPWALDQLLLAALSLGDGQAIRRTAERLRVLPNRGALTSLSQMVADAGVAAVDGGTSEARQLVAGALAEAMRLQLPFQAARYALALLHVLPEAPEATEWARISRDTFRQVGAGAYLAQLDGLPAGTAFGSVGASGISTPATSQSASTVNEPA